MSQIIISILLVGIGLVIGYFMRKKVYEAELERAQQTAAHIISKKQKKRSNDLKLVQNVTLRRRRRNLYA